ncbi:MAG: guanylate kinase [Candidatus Omnitrophica bacterium]|nr:guanylate kinase [Candidatus Omnitrophota bacterium]
MRKKLKKRIFVISAPSGTGKTTIGKILRTKIPGLELTISCTTRKPRPGEKNGIDYHFISVSRFRKMAENKKFAEWAEVYGNYYGTPEEEIRVKLHRGCKVLLTVDTQGGMNIKKLFPSAVLIGILPPSLREQEKRIKNRGKLTEKEFKKRMDAARKERQILVNNYDFRLINKNIETTIRKIQNIITKGKKY